jgi:hypothetical protein
MYIPSNVLRVFVSLWLMSLPFTLAGLSPFAGCGSNLRTPHRLARPGIRSGHGFQIIETTTDGIGSMTILAKSLSEKLD